MFEAPNGNDWGWFSISSMSSKSLGLDYDFRSRTSMFFSHPITSRSVQRMCLWSWQKSAACKLQLLGKASSWMIRIAAAKDSPHRHHRHGMVHISEHFNEGTKGKNREHHWSQSRIQHLLHQQMLWCTVYLYLHVRVYIYIYTHRHWIMYIYIYINNNKFNINIYSHKYV